MCNSISYTEICLSQSCLFSTIIDSMCVNLFFALRSPAHHIMAFDSQEVCKCLPSHSDIPLNHNGLFPLVSKCVDLFTRIPIHYSLYSCLHSIRYVNLVACVLAPNTPVSVYSSFFKPQVVCKPLSLHNSEHPCAIVPYSKSVLPFSDMDHCR